MYSKIEIRFEAAKIAASLTGITKDNFKDVAQIISDFIIGGVEIPDYKDRDAYLNKMIDYLANSTKELLDKFVQDVLAYQYKPVTDDLQNEQSENICGEICPKP